VRTEGRASDEEEMKDSACRPDHGQERVAEYLDGECGEPWIAAQWDVADLSCP
jgi:hypothetical protein